MSERADLVRYLSDSPPPYSSAVHARKYQSFSYPIPEIRVNGIPVSQSPIVLPLPNRTPGSSNHVEERLSNVSCQSKISETNKITTRTRCLVICLCCGASLILMFVILVLDGSIFRI